MFILLYKQKNSTLFSCLMFIRIYKKRKVTLWKTVKAKNELDNKEEK